MKYSIIEEAFMWVGSDRPCMNTALVHKVTGQTLYHSEMGELDEITDDACEDDNFVEVPHKNDLEWCSENGIDVDG